MNGMTSPLSPSTNDGKVKIKVKVPASGIAREMRDSILRDYFGFTISDIEELNRQYPNRFFICIEGLSNKEATPEQIRKLRIDPADGLHPMTLSDAWVTDLSAFRKQRVTTVVYKAVEAVGDPALKGKILEYLQKLLSPLQGERLTALNNLLVETGGSVNSSDQILAAVSSLTDQADYRDNPLLLLVKANAAFTEYRTRFGPGYDINARTLLAEAIRKANSNFASGSDQSAFSLSRGEAAFVSRHASSLYKYFGRR